MVLCWFHLQMPIASIFACASFFWVYVLPILDEHNVHWQAITLSQNNCAKHFIKDAHVQVQCYRANLQRELGEDKGLCWWLQA